MHRETVSNGEGRGILKTSSNCQLNLSIGLCIDCSLAVDTGRQGKKPLIFDACISWTHQTFAEAGHMSMMRMT